MHICMYNACKTHLHTKQWENLFYPRRTSRKKRYNSGTVYPVVTKMVLKCAQDLKEKSRQVSVKIKFALRSYCEKCRGGG